MGWLVEVDSDLDIVLGCLGDVAGVRVAVLVELHTEEAGVAWVVP